MPPALDRDVLFAARDLVGTDLCRAYSDRVDTWVRQLYVTELGAPDDVALVAVGGYGRAELCPQSDIDLVLIHGGRNDIADVAERLWYPIWDEGLKLGHAVRTVKEALALAASDLDTATSLLSVRHLGGDPVLTEALEEQSLALWRKRNKRWLTELAERVADRQRSAGEVAFLLEPDLKDGRGGLRDVHAVHWAEAADRVMFEGDEGVLRQAYEVLLATRVELHRRTGRPGDVLLLQEQDAVAEAVGDADADALMARIASAARTIAWRSDEVWDGVLATLKAGGRWRSARDRLLAPGVVLRDGRVHLTVDADTTDPVLLLRVAAEAAKNGTRLARTTLDRLVDESPVLPDPWPAAAREALVDLLATGPASIAVIESLDQRDLWVRVLPEWEPNRCRPQRNAYHRFTVDRHLVEACVEASRLVDQVGRADLLLIGTLLHDIGKGYPGDHTEVGIELVADIGPRLGYDADDVAVLSDMVRHHLLLPDVATRRDLSDEATIRFVAERAGTVDTLRLLGALTEADSIATGPAAWGTWKAELVRDLVARTEHHMVGGSPDALDVPRFPSEAQLALLDEGEACTVCEDDRLTIVAPDRPGLFSRVAGALALSGLAILDAAAYTHDNGMALESFRVESSLGPTIQWDRVLEQIGLALDGRLAIDARLAERARQYGRKRRSPGAGKLLVKFDAELSDRATVIEVHAPDALGVLYRITRTLATLDLDIRSAKVQTLGPDVVDSFYVVGRDKEPVRDPEQLAEIERALRHALEG